MKTILSLVLMFSLVATTGFAFKNVCKTCGLGAEPDDLLCQSCGKYLNECMICDQPNPVKNDSCEICCNPLVESRILGTIPPDVREEYRLGESPRARLERENSQLQCFLQRTPEQEAQLLFQLGMNLKRMKFYAREAGAWGNFLIRYPNHPQAAMAKIYRSEAFRNWGYLFFSEGNLPAAEEKLRSAVTENPNNVDAFVWLSRVELAMGNVTEGRNAAKAALAIEPGERRARFLLTADPHRLVRTPSTEGKWAGQLARDDGYEASLWFPEETVAQEQ